MFNQRGSTLFKSIHFLVLPKTGRPSCFYEGNYQLNPLVDQNPRIAPSFFPADIVQISASRGITTLYMIMPIQNHLGEVCGSFN